MEPGVIATAIKKGVDHFEEFVLELAMFNSPLPSPASFQKEFVSQFYPKPNAPPKP